MLRTKDKNPTAVHVEKLCKFFPKKGGGSKSRSQALLSGKATVLQEVSFSVNQGEIFGLLGGNGSGKSTLMRVLCTLLTPDSGRARIMDLDVVKQAREVKGLITRVSVDPTLSKHLSPYENLRVLAALYSKQPKSAVQQSCEALERFGLPKSALHEPVEKLSRGQQQMVSLARAFLSAPVVLVLDEPTTGLDPRSRKKVEDFILRLRDELGATILLATHDMRQAESLCSRIGILNQGKLIAEGTVSELRESQDSEGLSLEEVFLKVTRG